MRPPFPHSLYSSPPPVVRQLVGPGRARTKRRSMLRANHAATWLLPPPLNSTLSLSLSGPCEGAPYRALFVHLYASTSPPHTCYVSSARVYHTLLWVLHTDVSLRSLCRTRVLSATTRVGAHTQPQLTLPQALNQRANAVLSAEHWVHVAVPYRRPDLLACT